MQSSAYAIRLGLLNTIPRACRGILALILASVAPLGAADVPVNTNMEFEQSRPAVALATGGQMMVVWRSEESEFGAGSIQAQLFSPGGSPLGAQFQVSPPDLPATDPAITADSNGNFTVAWQSGGRLIQARRFAAAGTPLGDFFSASEDGWPDLDRACPDIEAADDGRFVIVWTGFNFEIAAQRYAADGSPVGPRILVTPPNAGEHLCPSVSLDQGANFVVAWDRRDTSIEGLQYDVYLQRFSANGTAAGPTVRVNDDSTFWHFGVSTALDQDGDALVAWIEYDPAVFNHNIGLAQRFSAAGQAVGDNFEFYPAAFWIDTGADDEGNFIVVFDTDIAPLNGIGGRRLDPAGNFIGLPLQISGAVAQQVVPAVGTNSQGDFVAAWAEAGLGIDPTGLDIVRSEVQNITQILHDGFETGDTSRWSQSIP